MTSKLKLLVATSAISVAMLGANPAFAADLGTDAGTSITNNVSVTYSVGGTAQTPPPVASDTFVVDREVNLVVTRTDNVNTLVAPEATQQALTYTVSNQTNDTIDVLLTSEQLGTDDFDVTGTITYYLDDGTTPGVFDAGDTQITSIEDLAEDETVTVHLVANIPTGVVTGNESEVILIGQAADTTGTAFVNNIGDADDPTLVQNVFADGAGTRTGGAAGDGYHSDTDTYEVSAANLTVAKTSTVLWDPINGSSDPKAIPGSVIEYCIAVTNAAGSAAATNVAITDDISALDLDYYATAPVSGPITIPTANGVVSANSCNGTGTNADASGLGHSSGTISGNLGNVAQNTTEVLLFRVTVQ
ncbi:MAG: hypothetical protein ABJN65_15615 [Parasphingorhabdus sp.]